MAFPLHFEDVEVGATYRTPPASLDEGAIKGFARQWDPQAFHLDEQAAAQSIFGGLVASGLHVMCAGFRMLFDFGLFRGTALAGVGLDRMTWRRPARPGDRISVAIRILSKRATSRPERGLVTVELETRNQDDDVILVSALTLLVARRTAPDTSDVCRVSVERRIDVAADTAWHLVANFPALDRWLPGARMERCTGSDVGAERHFSVGVATFHERLVDLAAIDRRMTYEVVDSTLPLVDYRAVVAIEAIDAGACRVSWTASFRVGTDPDRWRHRTRTSLEAALAALEEALVRRAAPRSVGTRRHD